MNYKFYAHGECTYVGTVEADSKEEAVRKIKDHDYDDVELVDDEMNVSSISECDLEADEDDS